MKDLRYAFLPSGHCCISGGLIHLYHLTMCLSAFEPKAELDDIQHPYTGGAARPQAPSENRLKIPIRAGEKLFHREGH